MQWQTNTLQCGQTVHRQTTWPENNETCIFVKKNFGFIWMGKQKELKDAGRLQEYQEVLLDKCWEEVFSRSNKFYNWQTEDLKRWHNSPSQLLCQHEWTLKKTRIQHALLNLRSISTDPIEFQKGKNHHFTKSLIQNWKFDTMFCINDVMINPGNKQNRNLLWEFVSNFWGRQIWN